MPSLVFSLAYTACTCTCSHVRAHARTSHAARQLDILLANLKFGDKLFNRQIAKLKPPLKFPIIRYIHKLVCNVRRGSGASQRLQPEEWQMIGFLYMCQNNLCIQNSLFYSHAGSQGQYQIRARLAKIRYD